MDQLFWKIKTLFHETFKERNSSILLKVYQLYLVLNMWLQWQVGIFMEISNTSTHLSLVLQAHT